VNKDRRLLVSVLTPVYNEGETLDRYEQAVSAFMDARPEYDFEVIFVDDGSVDDSWRKVREICGRDGRFRGLRLSRNRGSHVALTAAVDEARGDVVMTCACDLQDPIETFDRFIEKWRQGAKIVWGRRATRKDARWRTAASWFFNGLLRRFAMPKGSKFCTGSFFLIDRKVADSFKRFGEQNRITFAIVAWTGFDQEQVEYHRQERMAGSSGWTFLKMLRTVTDALLAYSTVPLRCISVLGALFFLFSFLFLVYLVVHWSTGVAVPGWTSIMAMFCFFSGIQCLLIGILGEYLQRIYSEVLARPLYCISEDTEEDRRE